MRRPFDQLKEKHMNQLTTVEGLLAADLRMTSREIAELTGKRHDNVLRDARAMLADLGLGGVLSFEDTQVNMQNGQSYPVLSLPKDLTLTLISDLWLLDGPPAQDRDALAGA